MRGSIPGEPDSCNIHRMFALRAATLDDFDAVLPRTRALNAHEGIEVPAEPFAAALRRLLDDPELGGVWLVLRDDVPIGYAIVTFGYDLEFAGRDAYLTELWIDADERGHGAGATALDLIADELRGRAIAALHLQVRRDNPAYRLYERTGFVVSPRCVMTRRL
jgi:ribosomal protein S18 acetylase RimI-like enzyme